MFEEEEGGNAANGQGTRTGRCRDINTGSLVEGVLRFGGEIRWHTGVIVAVKDSGQIPVISDVKFRDQAWEECD